jgi:ribosome-associated translation inhibitor RaiA
MAYGQGSLVETVGTMEISQEVDNGVNQNAPKGRGGTKKATQDTNNVTAPPSQTPANAPVKPTPAPAQTPAAAPVTAAEANAPDVNVPDINDFNSFKREIDRIDMSARGEDVQWLGKQEKKTELAQAMNNVAVAELRFLRKVAAATNDTNTVEAIDLVLKKRQDRLNKLVTKLENEAKEEHPQQRERRAPRTGGTQQGQSSAERPARNTNPAQRTVNQDQ